MGNRSSNKSSQTKIQFDDDENGPEIYKIIGRKGDGELVEIAKIAQRTKDLSKVDEYIKTKCSQFLINNGKGEIVMKKKHLN